MGMFDMIADNLNADAEFATAIAEIEAAALAEQAAKLETEKAALEAKAPLPIKKNGLNYRHDQISDSGDRLSVYTVANKGVELFHVVVNNSTPIDLADAPAAMVGRQNLVSVHPVRVVTVDGKTIETHILAAKLRFGSGAEHIDSCELNTYVVRNLMQVIAKIKELGGTVPGC